MNESQGLADLLERAADRTLVGPPPLGNIVRGARRRRRLQVAMISAAAMLAATTVVVGVVILDGQSATTGLVPASGGPTRSPVSISSVPMPSSPSPPGSGETRLDGEWTVRALIGTDGQPARPQLPDNPIRLTFTNGRLTGTTVCNTLTGIYQQGGTQGQDLRFPAEQLHYTSAKCDDPPLGARLIDVRHVTGSGRVRYLHAENWMIIAQLLRAP